MTKILFFTMLLFIYSHTFGQDSEVIFFKTTNKRPIHYIEFTDSMVEVYQMGTYRYPVGSGPAILLIDTLNKVSQTSFAGKYYFLSIEKDKGYLKTINGKKFIIEKVEDIHPVYLELNNAYYLKCSFDLNDLLKKKYQTYNYSPLHGYYTWPELEDEDKNIDHEKFKTNTNKVFEILYDSICRQQDKYTTTTNFLLVNLDTLPFCAIRDSLATLPVDYWGSINCFGPVANEIAKKRPDIFFKLDEELSQSHGVVFSNFNYDKDAIKNLRQVEGYEKTKKTFFRGYRFRRIEPYALFGGYAVIDGLLLLLIIGLF